MAAGSRGSGDDDCGQPSGESFPSAKGLSAPCHTSHPGLAAGQGRARPVGAGQREVVGCSPGDTESSMACAGTGRPRCWGGCPAGG